MGGSYKGRCQSQLKPRRESSGYIEPTLSATRKHGQTIPGVTGLRAPMLHPGGESQWPFSRPDLSHRPLPSSQAVSLPTSLLPPLAHFSPPRPLPLCALRNEHIRDISISSSSYHRLPASHSLPFSRMTRPYAIRALPPHACVILRLDLAFRPPAPPPIASPCALFPRVSIHPIVPSFWSSPSPASYLRYHTLPLPGLSL